MYKTTYKGMTIIGHDNCHSVEVTYPSGKEFGTFKSIEVAKKEISNIKDWVPKGRPILRT